MTTGISGFGFFMSKNGRFVIVLQNRYFYSVLGVRAFWARLSKMVFLDRTKNTDNFN